MSALDTKLGRRQVLKGLMIAGPDDIRARASAAVRAAFAGIPGEQSVMIDGAAWIITARNPAS